MRVRLVGLAAALALGVAGTTAAAGTTERVSVDSSGTQANDGSGSPAISGDGRYVAFTSNATNLDGADANGSRSDIYVHDRQTGGTTRVSVDSNGTQANDGSESPAISRDGRYVAFTSNATNLDGADANGPRSDIYVHDRQTGATTRVSVDSSGTPANGLSVEPAISGDGRYVAFTSDATNLDGTDSNGMPAVYVHDRQTGATTRVSVDSSGTQANGLSAQAAISGDGRYVAFVSEATNLDDTDTNETADVYVHEFGVPDIDGDGIADDDDNCPDEANSNQVDTDLDGEGDACDADDDNDTVADAGDICPLDANTNQADADGDGAGNACDADLDGDGVIDAADACVPTRTGAVVNADGCSIEDLVPCDSPWKNHGAYVSMIVKTAKEFLDLGLITEAERAAIVAAAGQSQCGQ
jgi:dipeptidyl aminopeptidase/acylaminoacyl peptidase